MNRLLELLKSRAFASYGTLLAIVIEAILFVGPPLGLVSKEDQTKYLFWGFLAFGFFGFRAYLSLDREHQALKGLTNPKIEIVFDPSNDTDSRPFLQTTRFCQQATGPIPLELEFTERKYRIGLLNSGASVVRSVSVVLTHASPTQNCIHLGHSLEAMDGSPSPPARDLPPSSDGQPTLWFDVVKECEETGQTPLEFTFCYASHNLRGPVPSGIYDITLRAQGGGISHARSFRIVKDLQPEPYGMAPLRMLPL